MSVEYVYMQTNILISCVCVGVSAGCLPVHACMVG